LSGHPSDSIQTRAGTAASNPYTSPSCEAILLSGATAIDMAHLPAISADAPPAAEAALVDAARGGDTRAFERLYRLHSGRVMGVCLRMCRRRDMAEDCVQLTFVRAWRNLSAFEGRSAFGTWLHRIAVNEVLTYARNHGTRTEPGESLDDTDEVASDLGGEFDAGEVVDVERALSSLPSGARHVMVLQAVYGYSHEEVAEMLGIAVGTCKAQLHRARKLMRERMGISE
jgi:RNA polymerase sigma-70 factor (ECF subfamily)